MKRKCSLCKKEEVQIWIPEFTVCNKCIAKGFFQVHKFVDDEEGE